MIQLAIQLLDSAKIFDGRNNVDGVSIDRQQKLDSILPSGDSLRLR